jgi:hypothetical protein
MDRVCENCIYFYAFKPRPDEVERGLEAGCKKPNFEGYTKRKDTCCFYWEKPKENEE